MERYSPRETLQHPWLVGSADDDGPDGGDGAGGGGGEGAADAAPRLQVCTAF